MHSSLKFIGKLGGATVGALLVAVLANYAPASAEEPGVARLTALSGDVAIRRGDSSSTYAATSNAPLMVSDYLSTGNAASHAELQFDYGNFLRLGSGVQLRVSRLDPDRHTVQLASGTVLLSELHATNAHPEIDTPSITVRPNEPGRYRVTVDGDGATLVTVRSGSATLLGSSVTRIVDAGTTVAISGAPADPRFTTVSVVAFDDFDSWNQSRDAFDGNDSGYQYANNQIVGIPDLSQYGTWSDNSQYGYGWTPSNAGANFAPYQNGQWVWEPNYGYTWVGNEPWGWAPYHYGTWLNSNNVWSWYPNAGPQYPAAPYPYVGTYPAGYSAPSPYGYPPYATGYPYGYGYPYPATNASELLWAPAMVAFLGLLGGANMTPALLSAGTLGWTPLAPGEPIYPWWGPQQAAWYGYPTVGYPNYQTYAYGWGAPPPSYYQPVYAQSAPSIVNSYTTYNITRIYRIYRNAATPHGVMVIGTKSFQNGQFRSIRATTLASARLSNVAVFRNVVPVTPTAANLRYTQAGPTRIASIAPKTALFERFAPPAERPTQFAAVRSKVTDATQQLFAAHPTMPGPVLAKQVRNAAKPSVTTAHDESVPNSDERKSEAANATERKPEAANVTEHKTEAANVTERKPEAAAHPNESSAWQRFGEIRGQSPSEAKGASSAHETAASAPDRGTVPERATTEHATAQHATTDAAAQPRSNSERDESRPAAPTYQHESAEHSVSAPERTYTAPEHTYSAPAHSAPEHAYTAPEHTYSAPEHTHSAPAHTYSAPAHTYSAPEHTYSAPAHSYSAPQHQSAPAPQHQPAAQHPATAPSSHGGGNGNGGDHHGNGGGPR